MSKRSPRARSSASSSAFAANLLQRRGRKRTWTPIQIEADDDFVIAPSGELGFLIPPGSIGSRHPPLVLFQRNAESGTPKAQLRVTRDAFEVGVLAQEKVYAKLVYGDSGTGVTQRT